MKGRFRELHARAFGHATEDLERVKLAMTNALGAVDLSVRQTEGVHGNPIAIVEASTSEQEIISGFFSRLSSRDLGVLMETLDKRVDEGCNMFVKIDKQSAFLGKVSLGGGDDVISVRLRVAAFPASCDIAQGILRETIEHELSARAEQH